MDAVLAELLAIIDRFGWAVRHVGAGSSPEEAAFSYTIGLTALGHPEIVMTGMPFGPAQAFLNLVGGMVKEGRVFGPGTLTHDLTDDGSVVAFVGVSDTSGLTAVEQVFGRVEALQLVWCDSHGAMPWEAGYVNAASAQPIWGPLPEEWAVDDAPMRPTGDRPQSST